MATGYITHPLCLKHDMGAYHPESPARIQAIEESLGRSGLMEQLQKFEAPEVAREQLLRVHAGEYIDFIAAKAPQHGIAMLDPDTSMNPYTYPAALRAAGAVVLGVDLVMEGRVQSVFCNVRPPGHHAERARAMGFCIFNNVAVGAAHSLEHHGIERVAILDFDVHHGNGTENIFHDDPHVMLCSTFQHPFYPFVGANSGNDHIINVPLSAGADGEVFRTAIRNQWLPALEEFKPELIMISAGFDAHRDDGLAMLGLVESDYVWITEKIKDVADRYAGGRIVSVLEGGYNLQVLGNSVLAHIKELI